MAGAAVRALPPEAVRECPALACLEAETPARMAAYHARYGTGDARGSRLMRERAVTELRDAQRRMREPLQAAVRRTRRKLTDALARWDRREVIACIAELRSHADRAEAEAGHADEAAVLLRNLANETERRL